MWSYYSTRSASVITTSVSSSGRTSEFASTYERSVSIATWLSTNYRYTTSTRSDVTRSDELVGGLYSYTKRTIGQTNFSFSEASEILFESPPTSATSITIGSTTSAQAGQTFDFYFSSSTSSGTYMRLGAHSIVSIRTTLATSAYTEWRSSSGSSSTFVSSTSSSSTNGSTGASFSSSTEITGTFNNTRVTSYNYTTTTSTSTGSVSVSTTATRASTFLTNSSSSSVSSSSADPYTTHTTVNSTQTFTTYSTSSVLPPVYFDLVIETDSNDWLWDVTATGSSQVSNIGSTIGNMTFTEQGISASSVFSVFNSVTTSHTYSLPQYGSSSVTSTVSTTFSSTYSLGVAGSNQSVPFSATTSAAISYTGSSNTTFTFSTSTATIDTSFVRTASSTFLQSLTNSSTWAGGTSIHTETWTIPFNLNGVITGTSATTTSWTNFAGGGSDSYSQISGITVTASGVSNVLLAAWRKSVSVIYPASLSVREITIGAGFQSPASIGRLQPIGTNLVSGLVSSVDSTALGWPRTDVAPLATGSADIGIAGAVPITRTNSRTATIVGGFGWDSTKATTVSATIGVHRLTTANSTTTGVTTTQWGSTDSTYSLSSGHGLVAETVPLVNSRLTTSAMPFVNFPAFPAT